MNRSCATLLLLLVTSGCGQESAFDNEMTGARAPDDGIPDGTLRIDVSPPASDTAILLPQSHIVPPDNYDGLGIDLYGTRSVSGVLTAQVTHGWTLGAPTTSEPLVAGILGLPADGSLGAVAQSAEDGSFVLSYPAYPSTMYVAFIPVDAALAPLLVLDAPTYDRTGWDQEIAPGIPVYGRITGTVDGVEASLAGLSLRITRVVSGQVVSSAPFTTDRTGWYVARVDQLGEYTLEVVGGASTTDGQLAPALSVPVLVEALEGVEVPIALGDVEDASADGRVVDIEGAWISAAYVRFLSKSLDSGIGALEVEVEPNAQGRFIADLLPGVYDIEVIPRYDADGVVASAARYENVRVVDGIGLGELSLGAPTRLTGKVLDANAEPAADVQVVATEVGFGAYVYYGRTGADGSFDLPVADVPMVVTLTPAQSASGAVTHVEVDAPSTVTSFQLDAGVSVSGRIAYEGTAIPYASVQVYDAGSGVLLGQAFSDESGGFALRVSLPEPSHDLGDTGADTGADTASTDTASDSGADSGSDTASDTASDSGADTAADSGADSAADTAR
ncbi:MAG: hypothetical protein Q8P41_01845 [Pseudomonadota bacterium]|nr:hypothetical protein [Pseudomonadota bacterium]